jgi:type II secretory pathway component GspD/PulD (secretin)
MENILPGRIPKAAQLVLLAFLATLVCVLPVGAQEQTSLPAEKAAEYQSHIDRGKQHLDQGKYREAIAEFNRALLLNPASEEAKKGIIKANQEIAARSAVPDTSSIERDRLNFHLTKGTEYYDVEKYDQAMIEWEQALQIDPENKLARSLIEAAKRAKVDLLMEKGHDEFFAGNFDGAISIWEEAQQIVPSSKVLADLLAEANNARHAWEMSQTEADIEVQRQEMSETLSRMALWPEGASADGLKRKDISLRPPPSKIREFGAREAILKELSQPVAFEFECEPLRGVLKFLTEITGINILTDEAIFEEFGKTEDCYGTEVDRNEIFVTIHVSELPLESALNGMLRQHGLGFSIERDFIYVSTPDVLRGSSFEQLETRFYHLKDTSRLSLPKLDTSGTTGGVSLGGRALNLASGQSLVGRVREITGGKLLEVDPDYISLSVPKLVNILRTFVPVVLDPTKQTQKRKAVVGADREVGGFEKQADQIRLFDLSRKLWADASGREILSMIDFDPHTNTLIVRNTPTNLDILEVFLDHLDQEPRQISVEAKFISYSLFEAERVGVGFKFSGAGGAAQFPADSISEGSFFDFNLITDISQALLGNRGGNILFRYTKADGDFLEATINLLSELESSHLVSAPRLVTLNNKPAVIQDVLTRSFRSDLTITTDIVQTPGSDTPVFVQSIDQEFTDVTQGITLSITPQIQADGTIRLFILPDIARIGPDLNTFVVTTSDGAGGTIVNTIERPEVERQSIFTNVVISDGDTIVIGGLIEDVVSYQKTGVPFFKDIPLLGRLFENEVKSSDRTNLLIFITVNIMDSRGVVYTRLK